MNYYTQSLYEIDINSHHTFWVNTAIVTVQAEPFFAKHGLTYCTMLLVPDNNEIIRIRNIPLEYVDSFRPKERLRRWSVVTNVPLKRTANLESIEKDSRLETFALDIDAIANNSSAFKVQLVNPYNQQFQYRPKKQYKSEELIRRQVKALADSVKKSTKEELRKLVVDNIGVLQSQERSLGVLSPDRIELIAKSLNVQDKEVRNKLALESRYFQSVILRVELFKNGQKLTSEPEKNPKFKSGSGMISTAKFKVIDWGAVVAETKYFKEKHNIDIKLIEKKPVDIASIYSKIHQLNFRTLRTEIKDYVYNSAHLDKYVPENEDKLLIMGSNQKRYAVWYANSFI